MVPIFSQPEVVGEGRLVALQKVALAAVSVYAVDDPRAKLGWVDYQEVGRSLQLIDDPRQKVKMFIPKPLVSGYAVIYHLVLVNARRLLRSYAAA